MSIFSSARVAVPQFVNVSLGDTVWVPAARLVGCDLVDLVREYALPKDRKDAIADAVQRRLGLFSDFSPQPKSKG